ADTWERVEVRTHSIKSHSLGLHQQSDLVRARVAIDEGSVAILEGRRVTVQLVDSDNRASLEKGEGYTPLVETTIDVKETSFPLDMRNEGYLEYTAHRTDTYYLVYRNEDWWNLTLQVADGDALDQQFMIKVYATILVLATVIIFAWAYGRMFDVNVRHSLGLVGRPKGPGSMSAQEPVEPEASAADLVLEAEGEGGTGT
ncbi:MAG: hypothetical protein JSW25_03970, partial [Thermoplasmata archaeon]